MVKQAARGSNKSKALQFSWSLVALGARVGHPHTSGAGWVKGSYRSGV